MAEPSIVLRAVEESDLEFTRATRSDPQVSSLALGRRFPITEVGERHWFERLGTGAFPTEATFIVADEATGSPLGLVALNDIDWVNRTSWFGIWIAPGHQGRGIGGAATRLAVEYARDRLGLRRVKLLVLADHDAAIAVYRRVGFVDEGRLVGEILDEGTPRDLLLLALRYDGGDE
jgi:RimJ/RimL family protein N-acetyltransferase